MSETTTSSSDAAEEGEEDTSKQSTDAETRNASTSTETETSTTEEGQPSLAETPPELQERGVKTIPTGRRPFITISKNGSISLNATARREYCDGAVAVQLGMDEDQNVLFIQPHPTETDGREEYLYSLPEGDGNATLSASSWLKHFGIENEETLRYKPRWDEDLQAIRVDLDQEGERPSTTRSNNGTQEAEETADSQETLTAENQ
jgi:hypothetical protein